VIQNKAKKKFSMEAFANLTMEDAKSDMYHTREPVGEPPENMPYPPHRKTIDNNTPIPHATNKSVIVNPVWTLRKLSQTKK
jgi:hypothetical protein